MIYIRDLPSKGIAPFMKGWAGIEGWGGLTCIEGWRDNRY